MSEQRIARMKDLPSTHLLGTGTPMCSAPKPQNPNNLTLDYNIINFTINQSANVMSWLGLRETTEWLAGKLDF